jgi:hypothetical protein
MKNKMKNKKLEKLILLQHLLPVVANTGNTVITNKILSKIEKIINKI